MLSEDNKINQMLTGIPKMCKNVNKNNPNRSKP